MDKIETPRVVHVLTERLDGNRADPDGRRRGRTTCGRVVRGWTGAAIATGITCGSCRRTLRRDGWQV